MIRIEKLLCNHVNKLVSPLIVIFKCSYTRITWMCVYWAFTRMRDWECWTWRDVLPYMARATHLRKKLQPWLLLIPDNSLGSNIYIIYVLVEFCYFYFTERDCQLLYFQSLSALSTFTANDVDSHENYYSHFLCEIWCCDSCSNYTTILQCFK